MKSPHKHRNHAVHVRSPHMHACNLTNENRSLRLSITHESIKWGRKKWHENSMQDGKQKRATKTDFKISNPKAVHLSIQSINQSKPTRSIKFYNQTTHSKRPNSIPKFTLAISSTTKTTTIHGIITENEFPRQNLLRKAMIEEDREQKQQRKTNSISTISINQ